jgi:hypothetical protein
MTGQNYEVLSPWAEVDPVPLKGLAPRLTDLNGKTIGLFANHKVAGALVQDVVEKRLKERFPKVIISRYKVTLHDSATLTTEGGTETEKPRFDAWLKGVDAVINAVGD